MCVARWAGSTLANVATAHNNCQPQGNAEQRKRGGDRFAPQCRSQYRVTSD